MKKKLISLIAATAAATLLAGCSSATPASDASAGGVRLTPWARDCGRPVPDYPPMEYLDGDKLIGADVDLITEVAKRMGKEVKFEQQKFDQIINLVRTERVDLAIRACRTPSNVSRPSSSSTTSWPPGASTRSPNSAG